MGESVRVWPAAMFERRSGPIVTWASPGSDAVRTGNSVNCSRSASLRRPRHDRYRPSRAAHSTTATARSTRMAGARPTTHGGAGMAQPTTYVRNPATRSFGSRSVSTAPPTQMAVTYGPGHRTAPGTGTSSSTAVRSGRTLLHASSQGSTSPKGTNPTTCAWCRCAFGSITSKSSPLWRTSVGRRLAVGARRQCDSWLVPSLIDLRPRR